MFHDPQLLRQLAEDRHESIRRSFGHGRLRHPARSGRHRLRIGPSR